MPGRPGVAGAAVYTAPEHWRAIDLLSDVHLCAWAPRTFEAWARHLRETDADAVFILGDLFEVWVGDDDDDPFAQQCLDVLREVATRRAVAFLPGNRDFLIGARAHESVPMARLSDPTLLVAWGQHLVLAHGDAWCLQDEPYQRFRAQVRSPAWQQAFLARPLAERREQARAMREASQAQQRERPDPALWADVDERAAREALEAADAATLVHGHTHRPAVHDLGQGRQRWVLSDWDFETDPPRADVLRLTREGLRRVAPGTTAR